MDRIGMERMETTYLYSLIPGISFAQPYTVTAPMASSHRPGRKASGTMFLCERRWLGGGR